MFESYGFAPRFAVDGDAINQAVKDGMSRDELDDLREGMIMNRGAVNERERKESLDAFHAAGVTCIFENAGEEGNDPLRLIKRLAHFIMATDLMKPALAKVVRAAEVPALKNAGHVGLCFTGNGVPLHQQWESVRDEMRYVRIFHEVGIRMMHLTYNRRNPIGDGAGEPHDGGLSDFEKAAVAEMNPRRRDRGRGAQRLEHGARRGEGVGGDARRGCRPRASAEYFARRRAGHDAPRRTGNTRLFRLAQMKTFLAHLALLAAFLCSANAAAPDPAKLHAWYRDEGVKSDGARITAWENASGAARALTRVLGNPQAHLVSTPGGSRRVVRFDGKSALWAPVNAWGSIAEGRTVCAFVRFAPGASGFLFDGSTKAGSAPAKLVAGKWDTKAEISQTAKAGEWQVLTFVFGDPKPPLGGFILGANVASQGGLACDVAEVLVADRVLGDAELKDITKYLQTKWGTPTDLPESQQPKLQRLPDDPRIFRTTIRKQGDGGVHTYRIPGLATTPKGTLIAVFDIRHKNSGDLPGDIDVGMMRSTDDGATWSAMQAIMDYDAIVPGSHGNGVGDPAVLVDAKTGAIFVAALWSKGARAWNGSGPGMTPDETAQFVIVKSTDDGVTW
ncbi:MAG: membrane dipeptidase, partial [Chthoniobacteraceae bacterium]